MKKFLPLCILLLSSCAGVVMYDIHRYPDWSKLDSVEKTAILENRDARANLFKDDKRIIYVGVRTPFESRVEGRNDKLVYGEASKANAIAQSKCKSEFNLHKAEKINSRVMSEEETAKLKLWLKTYYVFKCSKSSDQISSGSYKAPVSSSGKINTLVRSFRCSYKNGPSEIRINGSTAQEITSVGIRINYSNVTISDKGAFTLTGASNDPGRTWFIGAKSFLLLDIQSNEASCK